jgi:hypothetical protein
MVAQICFSFLSFLIHVLLGRVHVVSSHRSLCFKVSGITTKDWRSAAEGERRTSSTTAANDVDAAKHGRKKISVDEV